MLCPSPQLPRLMAAATLGAALCCAEQGVLVVHISDPQARPITGVMLSTRGDGSTGSPTDRAGKTRIRLAPGVRPGAWVALQVVRGPRDLVFISPWDSRARVPPFENESENFAPVVLAARGDRASLEALRVVSSIAARVCAASAWKNVKGKGVDAHRRAALEEVSRLFQLDPTDVDRALRALGVQSKDAYEKGMSALYQLDYPEATEELAQSLAAREKQLRRVPGQIINSAVFLGQALFEQGKFAEAAEAYRKALAHRPEDPAILNALGLSLIKAGKAAEAEPLLRRALELQQGISG